jgi:ankyrin repeat protein
MIYRDPKIIHLSPFYKAIDNDSIWAVELFADHGADLSGIGSVSSQNPLIYAAVNGMDDMCMYLSLRASNVDIEDNEGNNIFNMYLKKEDKLRCMQLLMRNANINHVNSLGKSPLDVAIENNLSKGMVKFLLQAGADHNHKDTDGKDCCERVRDLKDKYTIADSPLFKVFWDYEKPLEIESKEIEIGDQAPKETPSPKQAKLKLQ